MPTDEWERGFAAGWNGCMDRFGPHQEDLSEKDEKFWRDDARKMSIPKKSPKPKRKPSAANKAYSRAFAKVKGRFQKKNGQWKKGGFGKAVRAAHKLAKK
jgi:hypothetical protein